MNITNEHYSNQEGREGFLENKFGSRSAEISEYYKLDTMLSEDKNGGEDNSILLPSLYECSYEVIRLIERGQFFGKTDLNIEGEVSNCHNNVIETFINSFEKSFSEFPQNHIPAKNKYQMVTGYALSEDGVWRNHSWLLLNNTKVVETTESRIKYFGVVLSDNKKGLYDKDISEVFEFIRD